MGNEFGLHFPIVLDNVDYGSIPVGVEAYGSPAKPGLEDSIKSSIRTILAWRINTRNFAAPFGSTWETLLGNPNSYTTKDILETFLAKAIARWETRITLKDVLISQQDEYTVIQITASINYTKTDFNYDIIL